ncbi:MAG: cytochrome c biogenesis protein ResB [Candidatus Lernaella stagnicola]|nr:cytochrome c biogenesis protein ResB [Candidatus Lernaella stagnicola]
MSAEKKHNFGIIEDAVDWLASLSVTVYSLIALGVGTLIGTVFPQVGITIPAQVLTQKLEYPVWRILHLLGFTDVFHSFWFLFLVALLMLNLIACTWRYIKRVRRLLASGGEVLDESTERGAHSIVRIKTAAVDQKGITASLGSLGRVRSTAQGDQTHLFVDSRPWARYGIVVVHLSVLLILAGAMVKLMAAVEGHIMLPEGGSLSLFRSDDNDLLRLPFDIECRRFQVDFYEGSQRPKEFVSDLVVWKDGVEQMAKTIQVNDPLGIGGFRFFQATYGKERFPIIDITVGGAQRELPVVFGQIQSIPGTRDGFILNHSRNNEGTTELHIQVQSGGESFDGWLRQGGETVQLGEFGFAFRGVKEGYYTGLLVSADPSISFLWAGFSLFFIGLFWVMYFSHRRIWVRIGPRETVVAASSSRNREALARWLEAESATWKKG